MVLLQRRKYPPSTTLIARNGTHDTSHIDCHAAVTTGEGGSRWKGERRSSISSALACVKELHHNDTFNDGNRDVGPCIFGHFGEDLGEGSLPLRRD